MSYLYCSREPRFKRPFGAVKTGEETSFALRLEHGSRLHSPTLALFRADGWDAPIKIPLTFTRLDGTHRWYGCSFTGALPQLYFYCFFVEDDHGERPVLRGDGGCGWVSDRAVTEENLWQLTVYDRDFASSPLLQGTVVYQIFPDRFCSSGSPKAGVPGDRVLHQSWHEMPNHRPDPDGEYRNSDYFGGDLRGILEKLPYLKELGVGVLYLNPIFEAHSNHRYNTADYHSIDPLLGDEEDFRALCAGARALGISVLLDGVFSHTGSDSIYFNKEGRYPPDGAYNRPDSPYASWFRFTRYPEEYQSWWGFRTLPETQEEDPGFVDFICGPQGVIAHWMERGAAGWRLDVADELPPGTIRAIRRAVKAQNPQGPVVGEVWEDASHKTSYGQRREYLLGRELDSVMNYPFRDGILRFVRDGDGPGLYEILMQVLENYPKPVVDALMTSLSTHDTVRAISHLAGPDMEGRDRDWQARHHILPRDSYLLGVELLKLASLLQYTLPGSPCLYYGDEVGLSGYRDPFNRAPYPWGQEDLRLREYFKALGALRGGFPCLAHGEFVPLLFTHQVCAFLRVDGADGVFVAVNRSDQPVVLPLPQGMGEPVLGSLAGNRLAAMSGVVAPVGGLLQAGSV